MKPPRPISSSTSITLNLEAAPKCISGSTSYFSVWLAFHPYPQLIQRLFNVNWFGPPPHVTAASTWSWVDHQVSRLPPLTIRPIQTRFRFGSRPKAFNLASEEQLVGSLCKRHAVTRRLRPLVSVWFQVLFHSLIQGTFHLSLTVLVHYRSHRSI